MTQVIHADTTLLGLSFVVICMLLECTDQVLAAIPYLDFPAFNQHVHSIDSVLHQRVALLRAHLVTSFLQDAKV